MNTTHATRLVEAREHVVLTSPEEIVTAADAAFVALRALRDPIAAGQDMDAPEYEADLARYDTRLQTLRNAIRRDLGADKLASDVTL